MPSITKQHDYETFVMSGDIQAPGLLNIDILYSIGALYCKIIKKMGENNQWKLLNTGSKEMMLFHHFG